MRGRRGARGPRGVGYRGGEGPRRLGGSGGAQAGGEVAGEDVGDGGGGGGHGRLNLSGPRPLPHRLHAIPACISQMSTSESSTATRSCPPTPVRRTASPSASVPAPSRRSEENTSELQSLMRTSYAVFCLKTTKV